jgi:putative inorganic carbon (hco3(-)) transporter
VNDTLRRACTGIAEHEFWLLWVYGAPLLFASNLPPLLFFGALLTIPFFWLARRITRGAWSVATPLDLPLALWLVMGLVGVAISNNFVLSAQLYAELLGGVALYYGIVNGLISARLSRGVWLVLALGTGMALFGAVGLRYTEKFLPLPVFGALLPRLDVTRLNPRGFTPNIVAGAIAPIVPLTWAWVWTQKGWRRILVLVLALIMTAVCVFTQSRGALFGILIALVVLVLWRAPRLAWLLPVGAGLLVVLLILTPLGARMSGLFDDPSSTLNDRAELWQRAIYVMRDFPFTGIGLGTFEPNILRMYPLLEATPGEPQPHAHNIYLQMGVDYGIGGLVAFLGMVTTTLGIGVMTIWRLRATPTRWLAIGLFAGCVAFLLHGLLDAVFTSTKVSEGIWMMLAMLMILARENE